jgi:hypothetical protein
MALTVSEGFDTFHSWLTPTGTESANAKSHRASIEACLKTNFGMTRFFRTGSFGNATSVSGYSDVDYFASIPREKLKQDSGLTLKQVKDALDTRFPSTGVHIDGPAVVVPFGSNRSETTEIVPADFIKREHDCSTYEIPNGYGGWMLSSPELSKLNIDVIDRQLKNKVKPLIRFIKAWRYYRNVPISSFYLETYVGIYAETQKSIVYSIDIAIILSKLLSSNLPNINDPMGVSGVIQPCKNIVDRNKSLKELADAVNRSKYARTAESENRMKDAFYWWNVVYNDLFPGYY